jgi:hypothetical protein
MIAGVDLITELIAELVWFLMKSSFSGRSLLAPVSGLTRPFSGAFSLGLKRSAVPPMKQGTK